jgi:hypothetical protein
MDPVITITHRNKILCGYIIRLKLLSKVEEKFIVSSILVFGRTDICAYANHLDAGALL